MEKFTAKKCFVWKILMKTCLVIVTMIKRALDKYENIILQLSPKRVKIFVLLEVLAWVMTACWILHSSLIYFWRNMHISSIFYFSKSTSINTQYSSQWDTLKMMLFSIYKILNKMKMLWQNQLKISVSVLFKTLYWSRSRCYICPMPL